MRLSTDRLVASNVSVILVLGEELVATRQYVAQPAEHLAVVADQTLDQLLAYVVQDLRAVGEDR